MQQIRVLVVDDSIFFRDMLVKNLNKDPALTVVASARDAYEARDAIVAYQPDVMTLDIEMPKMSGLDFLRKLMPQYPMPVVMISALNDKVFDAMSAGAVDFVAKPAVTDRRQLEEFIMRELPVKIKIASTAKISSLKRRTAEGLSGTVPGAPEICTVPGMAGKSMGHGIVIAIGASTGGTEAIAAVLSEFGTDIPGIVMVQHMPAGFTDIYAKRLDNQCRVHVKEARTGDRVLPGHVLLAPGGDSHMRLVEVGGTFQVEIREGGKVNGHSPSVDVLFDSVASAAGERALGIILTGMGGDGAKGLLTMRKNGAHTIGQDESTCVVYGMPKVAYELGAVEYQEKLPDIAQRIYRLIRQM